MERRYEDVDRAQVRNMQVFRASAAVAKGWCRHPLLYAPHQSHLVSEDDLDCDRGMTNYWEPAEQPPREPTEEATHEFQVVREWATTGGSGEVASRMQDESEG